MWICSHASIEHPPCTTRVPNESKKGREYQISACRHTFCAAWCSRIWPGLHSERRVHTRAWREKGRYKHLIGPNAPRPLSETSAENLHKHITKLKTKPCGSLWDRSKRLIDSSKLSDSKRQSGMPIQSRSLYIPRKDYRIKSNRWGAPWPRPLLFYKHSLNISNFKIKIPSVREGEWRQTRTVFIQQIFIVGKPCSKWTTGR